MEFNSRLDDKITACGENQKWQSVTPQYRSIVDLCAKTANAKSAVLKFSIKLARILHIVSVSEKKSRRKQIIPAGDIPCYISRQTL